MRLFAAFVVTLLLLLPAIAQQPPARESTFKSAEEFNSADVAAIHAMRDRWVQAFAAGNPAPVEFMFAGDSVISVPNSISSPEELFRRYDAKLVFDPKSRFVTDGGDPRKTDKLPWVSYYAPYTLTLTPKGGGKPAESGGQFMTRFHRQADGSLKVARGPRLGERAPDFTLNRMKTEGVVQLGKLRGKPVVLIFGSYT